MIREIKAEGVRSLVWEGDELVDWVGGDRYHLDGTSSKLHIRHGDPFDAAVTSPSCGYAVIYERLGTKGLLLDRGIPVRELTRSEYHAETYEYPICLFALPDGRELIAHCPEAYNRIDIEELDTGRRLTDRESGPQADFFHSRFAVSPDGRWLVSAGWFWHPCSSNAFYEIAGALHNPASLDPAPWIGHNGEISSAAFAATNLLLLAASRDDYCASAQEAEQPVLQPGEIGLYDLSEQRYVSRAMVEEEIGTIMPVGEEHVVGFYEHPKLFHVPTGEIVRRWSELQTGKQVFSIIWGIDPVPPLAMDPANRRFAVADKEKITVVTVDTSGRE